MFIWRWCHSHPSVSSTSSLPKSCTLCRTEVRELEPAPNCPLPSYLFFSLCFAFVIFKVVHKGRMSVSLPLEHILKMENKMHCDILAKRPFSGFGKSKLNRRLLLHSRKKTTQPKCHLEACLLLNFHCAFDYSSFSLLRRRGQSYFSSAFLHKSLLLLKATHMKAILA